jgi:hypothetical protein
MTISKNRVKPSRKPDQWKLKEIFATGVVMGTYLAMVTVLFYWTVTRTTFFEVAEHQVPYRDFKACLLDELTERLAFLCCRPISR